MSPLVPGRAITWVAAAIVAGADQATKMILLGILEPGRPVTVIPGLFDLTLVTNTGGVFGILQGLEGPLRGLLFGLLPLLAIGLMIWYARSLDPSRLWPLGAIGLILGGAAGNLVDRIRFGHVVDFFDAYIGQYHWPAFNVADSGITVGVALLLIESLLPPAASRDGRQTAPPASP